MDCQKLSILALLLVLVRAVEKRTIAKKGNCLDTFESPYARQKSLLLSALITRSHFTFDCFTQSNSVIYWVATVENKADSVGNTNLHWHICNPKFSTCSTTVNEKYAKDNGLCV